MHFNPAYTLFPGLVEKTLGMSLQYLSLSRHVSFPVLRMCVANHLMEVFFFDELYLIKFR